ncbi:MAG: hypothetical protein KJO72_07235 [Gammaproteobacteria bacterium]|nr:hypothetical protein [Gammaproteobacteria bacterium]
MEVIDPKADSDSCWRLRANPAGGIDQTLAIGTTKSLSHILASRRTLQLAPGLMLETEKEQVLMATIENVRLTITALTEKPGYSQIAYSYELHPSELDCTERREYSVSTDVWGEDLIDDDVLAWGRDGHRVKFENSEQCEPIKVERTFEVKTQVLNEDIFGEDEVYLMVEVSSGSNPGAGGPDAVFGRSNTVTGQF